MEPHLWCLSTFIFRRPCHNKLCHIVWICTGTAIQLATSKASLQVVFDYSSHWLGQVKHGTIAQPHGPGRPFQQITGKFQYYLQAVDLTMKVALRALVLQQSKAMQPAANNVVKFLNYCATNHNSMIQTRRSVTGLPIWYLYWKSTQMHPTTPNPMHATALGTLVHGKSNSNGH